jgi:hypothetical protein
MGVRKRKTEMLSGNLLDIAYSENREDRIKLGRFLERQVVRIEDG